MRCWAVWDAESIEKILDWLAGQTWLDSLGITGLAIQVTRETLFSDAIWIVAKWALRDAVRSTPLHFLPHNYVRHVVWSKIGALGITLAICQEGDWVLADKAILVSCSITKLASFVTVDISYLDVLVPLGSDMSELTELVLRGSDEFDVSHQHTFIAHPKVEIADSEVCLEHVLNVNSGNRRSPCTEWIDSVDHPEIKINCPCLEQSLDRSVHV